MAVKLYCCEAVGVPLIVPPEASVKPGGRLPELTVQLYGGVPPVAVKTLMYAVPTPPGGRAVVVIDNEEPDVMESVSEADADWAGELESFTSAVKLYCPEAVGVPLMFPLEASAKPGGKLPELTVQLYGIVPPDAINALEYPTPIAPAGRELLVINNLVA